MKIPHFGTVESLRPHFHFFCVWDVFKVFFIQSATNKCNNNFFFFQKAATISIVSLQMFCFTLLSKKFCIEFFLENRGKRNQFDNIKMGNQISRHWVMNKGRTEADFLDYLSRWFLSKIQGYRYRDKIQRFSFSELNDRK